MLDRAEALPAQKTQVCLALGFLQDKFSAAVDMALTKRQEDPEGASHDQMLQRFLVCAPEVASESLIDLLALGEHDGLPELRDLAIHVVHVQPWLKEATSVPLCIGDAKDAAEQEVVLMADCEFVGDKLQASVPLELLWSCPLYAPTCEAKYREFLHSPESDVILSLHENIDKLERNPFEDL